MKTILVTGGAGFIGSHSVLELLDAGYDVVVLDNFVNAVRDKDNFPVSLHRVEQLTGKKITFYTVDILNREQLKPIFESHKFDCVIHFAALKAVGESVAMPLEYYKNNVIGAMNLLEVMKEAGVKNFVFSSSATVYGSPQKLPLDENHPVGQGITNPYGKTKYFIEEILFDMCKADPSWNVVILRYFNPVGAHKSGLIGEDPKGLPNNLMPYVAQVCVGKLPHVRVYGNDYDTPDGTGVRDYIHIVDLAKGHVAAIKKIAEGNIRCKVYNLGTGRGYSVLEMIKALEKASGKNIPYQIEGRREGDIGSVYCDTTYAEKDLHWKAEYGLEEMCKDLWKWQETNPQGFQIA
jgi:UDP-glucose 4-epimerase